MRTTSILLSTLFGFWLFSAAAAQSAQDELADLRAALGVDASTAITTATLSEPLPAGDPLKVYIATGLDITAQANITRKITDWNHGDGKKHGRLEIVGSLAEAQIVLARYRKTDLMTTETRSSSYVVPGTAWDPVANKVVTAPVAKNSTSSTTVVPAYAYILVNSPNSIKIYERYVAPTSMAETGKSGTTLTDWLFKILKKQKR